MCKKDNNCFSEFDLKNQDLQNRTPPIITDFNTGIVAQPSTATGNVKDYFGALPNVNIVVKSNMQTSNYRIGGSTNSNGNFSIDNVPFGVTLVFSHLGYKTQEIRFTGQPIMVTLIEDVENLDEVVITNAKPKNYAFAWILAAVAAGTLLLGKSGKENKKQGLNATKGKNNKVKVKI